MTKASHSFILLVLLASACGPVILSTPTPAPPQILDPVATSAPVEPARPPLSLRIAYVKGHDVWVWNEAGKSQITFRGDVQQVAISPEGDWVAYIASHQLLVTRVDSAAQPPVAGETRTLVSPAYLIGLSAPYNNAKVVDIDFVARPPAPDPPLIYVKIYVGGEFGGLDLYLTNPDRLFPQRDLPDNIGSAILISPDGACKAIVHLDQLAYTCGHEPHTVMDFDFDCPFGQHSGSDLVWSAESDGFYFVAPSCNQEKGLLSGHEYYWFSRKGGKLEKLYASDGYWYSQIDISPDGSQVAYLTDRGNMVDLRVNSPTGEERLVATLNKTGLTYLGWAFDSVHVVLGVLDQGLYSLYYVNTLDGSTRQLLGSAPGMEQASAFPILTLPQLAWVSSDRFVVLTGADLLVGAPGQLPYTVDTADTAGILNFDFAYRPPSP